MVARFRPWNDTGETNMGGSLRCYITWIYDMYIYNTHTLSLFFLIEPHWRPLISIRKPIVEVHNWQPWIPRTSLATWSRVVIQKCSDLKSCFFCCIAQEFMKCHENSWGFPRIHGNSWESSEVMRIQENTRVFYHRISQNSSIFWNPIIP